jgi:hypothetical protein
MYVDIMKSMLEADMWRNIQYQENITNSNVGLQLLNIVETSCGWDDSNHGIMLTVVYNAVKNL